MICTTIRNGLECPFMTVDGCNYNGGICHQTIEQCDGCGRSSQFESGWYCTACPEPAVKWKTGNCNFATHIKNSAQGTKAKINPLKASKRSKR